MRVAVSSALHDVSAEKTVNSVAKKEDGGEEDEGERRERTRAN